MPKHIVDRLHLVSRDAAIRMIHYPHSHLDDAEPYLKELPSHEAAMKFPERKVYVVDSLCASSGYGMLMDLAADYRDVCQ